MPDTPEQKTKTIGYIDISALTGLPEWRDYNAAVSLADKSRTKAKVRYTLKETLKLDADTIIDFILAPDKKRIMVYQDLTPPKDKNRGKDLSDLFKPKKK